MRHAVEVSRKPDIYLCDTLAHMCGMILRWEPGVGGADTDDGFPTWDDEDGLDGEVCKPAELDTELAELSRQLAIEPEAPNTYPHCEDRQPYSPCKGLELSMDDWVGCAPNTPMREPSPQRLDEATEVGVEGGGDESEVEITAVGPCQCKDCLPFRLVDLVSDDETEIVPPIANPARGGQRASAAADDSKRRRMMGKTAIEPNEELMAKPKIKPCTRFSKKAAPQPQPDAASTTSSTLASSSAEPNSRGNG